MSTHLGATVSSADDSSDQEHDQQRNNSDSLQHQQQHDRLLHRNDTLDITHNNTTGYPLTSAASYGSQYTDASASDMNDLSRMQTNASAYMPPIVQQQQQRDSSVRGQQQQQQNAHNIASTVASGTSTPSLDENGSTELTLGRTSIQANKLLVEMFESFSSNYHRSHPFRTSARLGSSLFLNFNSLAFLLLLCCMWISYGILLRVHILVECCMLTVNWVLNGVLETYLQYLSHTEMLRLLRARMELVLDLPPLAETRTTEMPPSSTFVRTLRDGTWRPLPMNLLVSGDIIELDPDDRPPCPVKRIQLSNSNLASSSGSQVSTPHPFSHNNWTSQTQLLSNHGSYSNLHNLTAHAASSSIVSAQATPARPPISNQPSSHFFPNSTQSSVHQPTPSLSHLHNPLRYRDQSTLSSIRSDSAAEAAADDEPVATPAAMTRTVAASASNIDHGVEMTNRKSSIDVFNTSGSIASSYSATPSPASTQNTISPPVGMIQPAINSQPQLPPPPPPSPPQVPIPPTVVPVTSSQQIVDEQSRSASAGSVSIGVSMSQPPSDTPPSDNSPQSPPHAVQIQIDSPQPASGLPPHNLQIELPPSSSTRRRNSIPSITTPQSHLEVPPTHSHHVHHTHHASTTDVQSPVSSVSSASAVDPETKEQLRQTDATFLPANVLQPLITPQPNVNGNINTNGDLPSNKPIKSYSTESNSSTASTLLGDDPAVYQTNFAPSASTGVPASSAAPSPNIAPNVTIPLQGLPFFSNLSDEGPRHYIVEESPLRPQLEFILQPRTQTDDSDRLRAFVPPTNTFLARFNYVISKQKYLALAAIAFYAVFVLVRLGLRDEFGSDRDPSGSRTYEWVYWIFYCSSLLVLPLLNISNTFWLFILDTLGNSILLVTQEEMQNVYDDEANNSTANMPKKTTASLLSSASRQRAMKKRVLEAAKAKARQAHLSKKKKNKSGLGGVNGNAPGGAATLSGPIDDAPEDEESLSSRSSISSSSSEETASTESSRDSDDDELDEDAHTYSIVDGLTLPVTAIIRHSFDIITGREFYITRTVNPLQVLGGITVFCCLDNEGILSENEPSADHICFLSQPQPGVSAHASTASTATAPPSTTTTAATRHHHHHHHRHAQPKVIVLDLMNDPEAPNGLVIEGGHEQHLNSLKPLGLNSVLNNACNLPHHMLSQYEFSSTEPTTVTTTSTSSSGGATANGTTTTTTNSQDSASSSSDADSGLGCLCSLGREIGFDVNFIKQQYYVGKVIYTVAVQNTTTKIRPKRKHRLPIGKTPSKANSAGLSAMSNNANLPSDLQILSKIHTMTSMSVQDRFQPSSLHLMTNGDPFLVLFHSTHFWNGRSIQPLSEQIRTQLLGIYQQWNHQDLKCLAYSYAPIYPPSIYNYVAMFNPEEKVEYVIENLNEEYERKRAHTLGGHGMTSASSSSSLSNMSDIASGDVPQSTSAPTDSNPMAMPPRRRFATEHSTIVEQDEDEHKHHEYHPNNEVHPHDLHDDAHHHDRHDDAFIEHSQHMEDVHQHSDHHSDQHHDDDPLLHDEHHSINHRGSVDEQRRSALARHPSDADNNEHERHEYSRSYSTSVYAVSPQNGGGVNGSQHLSPLHLSPTTAVRTAGTIPPPPPSPPQVSVPPTLDITESTPRATVPDERMHASAPAIDTSHASTPSHYVLEAYTPKPRKPLSATSHSITKSQSFPSGFQPHISLGSMLPSELGMLESNLQPPVFAPTMQRHQHQPNNTRGDERELLPVTAPSSHRSSAAEAPFDIQLNSIPLNANQNPDANVTALTTLPTERDLLKSLQSSQIFLGMIAMRDQPKIEVRALVEDMKNAGIRFVFFSPDNERKTQAFGGKIGLFTEFNFYVSLRDPETTEESAPKRATAGKSQLPCGVSAIRNHLQTVDNVPLLVSLFTDCDPTSCRDMVRIMQENGESVMIMGSSLKVENTQAFMQADISASLDPMPAKACPYKTYNKPPMQKRGVNNAQHHPSGQRYQPPTYQQILQQYHNANGDENLELANTFTYSEAREFAASSAITSMPCALLLSATTDLHHFMALICEGRRLLHCMTQSLVFCAASYGALFLVLFVNFIVNAPPILCGYQILWLVWFIIPLLSLSLLHTPRELDLMRNLPQKNTVKEEGLLTIGGVGMMEEGGPGRNNNNVPTDSDDDDDEPEHDEDGHEKPRRKKTLQPRLPRRNPNPPGILSHTDITRYTTYFFIRFAWSAMVYLIFFLWFLHMNYSGSESGGNIRDNFYWSKDSPHSLFNDSSFQSMLLTTQNYSLFVFVFILVIHSLGFVYRYDSIRSTNPFGNSMWIVTSFSILVLQLIFCIISVYSVSLPTVNLIDFLWYVFLPWPFIIIALDEACKSHDRRHRDFNHKKARQHFDTVLGMHSPK